MLSLNYGDHATNVTNSAFYLNGVSTGGPIATL